MSNETPFNRKMIFKKRTILSFVIAFTILILLVKNVDLMTILPVIKSTNVPIYILAIIVFYSSFLVRGIRWQILLKNLRIKVELASATEILFLSWFANCIIPAKIGDVYRSYLLKKYDGSQITVSMGTIIIERLFDLSILIALLTISGAILFKDKMPAQIYASIEVGYVFLALIVIVLVSFYLFKKQILDIIPRKYTFVFENMYEGMYCSCKSRNAFVHISFLTIVIWALEIGRFFFVTRALGIDLPLTTIIFVALAASFLSAIPLTPAGLGAVELSIVGILAIIGTDASISTSLALLDRLISYWSILLSGFLLYIVSDKK